METVISVTNDNAELQILIRTTYHDPEPPHFVKNEQVGDSHPEVTEPNKTPSFKVHHHILLDENTLLGFRIKGTNRAI